VVVELLFRWLREVLLGYQEQLVSSPFLLPVVTDVLFLRIHVLSFHVMSCSLSLLLHLLLHRFLLIYLLSVCCIVLQLLLKLFIVLFPPFILVFL
jgi:hypothetical protein